MSETCDEPLLRADGEGTRAKANQTYLPMLAFNIALFAIVPASTEYLISRVCEDMADNEENVGVDCSSTSVSSKAAQWGTIFSSTNSILVS
jgi:hypothetical protein